MDRIGKLVRRAGVALGVALAALALGCDKSFDPSSVLNTLRVLAVRADSPYPKPGTHVQLEMLYYDGKSPPDQPRAISVLWLAGCFDPAGDLYQGCFSQLSALFGNGPGDPSVAKLVGFGTTFGVDIPPDIISRRPRKQGLEPYGLTYVFFAVCAGKLVFESAPAQDALPLSCYDSNGTKLGPDDYVPGYFSLYSYENRTNQNPILNGVAINGTSYPEVEPIPDTVLPACNGQNCADLPITPSIDPSSAEIDPGAVDPLGRQLTEQIWVDYYASAGSLSTPGRLVNDAQKGWNAAYGVTYQSVAPGMKAYLFVVVHDNRGGVAWLKRRVVTQ